MDKILTNIEIKPELTIQIKKSADYSAFFSFPYKI